MKLYGIWNVTEDTQEVRDYNTVEVINFAETERKVNTNQAQKITTLSQATKLLQSIGYSVEEV